MKLSIIIPAYNEAKRIEACVRSVFDSLRSQDNDLTPATEVIVVDNNSTDATAQLARAAGANVVFEPINQIARARNRGASIASGEWFLFLDADTLVTPQTISELLDHMGKADYVGGASLLRFDDASTILKLLSVLGNLVIRCSHLTCGCFIFCRADVFREIGGFNEKLYAAEDAAFGYLLKRWARRREQKIAFVRRHPPITSSRKLELYGLWDFAMLFVNLIFFPKRTTRDKQHLDIFYDGRR
jgi:glycosyltransferase involved in cell wall biosynthesis